MKLTLPPPPEAAPSPPFPVLGVIAPLVAAAVLFAVTRSPFALIFAALSPVILVAGIVDARMSVRRRRRRARRSEERAVARLRGEVEVRHRIDRAARFIATPPVRAVVDGSAPDSLLWRGLASRDRPFVLGLGPVPSDVTFDGMAGSEATRALVEGAAVLTGAPVLAGRIPDLGLCGPPALTASVARGLLLQIAFLVHPAEGIILSRPPGEEWDWVDRLPHRAGGPELDEDAVSAVVRVPARQAGHAEDAGRAGHAGYAGEIGGRRRTAASGADVLRVRIGADDVLIAMAGSASALPRACDTVLMLTGVAEARLLAGRCTVVEGSAVRPEPVSRAAAEVVARRLADRALRAAATERTELPDRVELHELVPLDGVPLDGPPSSLPARAADDLLRAVLGRTESGLFSIDLAGDGPHAVVGGTTGSGKSELLITWVVSLARSAGPSTLTFLLVDFKGGASFDALARLPHCVGLLTDLDSASARRALESLRAELRFRERWLRGRGIRSIVEASVTTGTDGNGLARLVIVVDEYAAMLAEFPELHDLFADIASRGRSLGIHLILCTQRPAGVVRDSVLANCGLRLSLRVNSRTDSAAVIGTDAAAALPRGVRGRCLVSTGGGAVRPAQIATVPPPRLARFVELQRERAAGVPPRRPWLDPLPPVLPLTALEDPTVHRGDLIGAIVFGLLDEPADQRRSYAAWHPERDGSLLVLGAHRSGKSSLLRTLAAVGTGVAPAAAVFDAVPADPIDAWDAVSAAFDAVRSGSRVSRILALDDVDATAGRLDAEYGPAFVDMVCALAREGPAAGMRLVLTAQRLSGGLTALAPLVGRTMLLRLPNRQEHALAGGEVATFDPDLPPGGGWWRGCRMQIALAGAARGPAAVGRHAAEIDGASTGDVAGDPGDPLLTLHPGDAYAIVSTRPAAVAALLRPAVRGADTRVTVTALAAGAGPGVAFGTAVAPIPSAAGLAAARPIADRPTADTPSSDAPTTGTPAAAGIDVIVGDPDEWQAAWGSLASAMRVRHVVFDACTARDYRALTRSAVLPPPLRATGRSVWYLPPGQRPPRPERRQWP